MKKLVIEKTPITLNSNMNKKNLSLDTKKAEPIKKNIHKQLEIIHRTLDELDSILNRLAIKNMLNDDYKSFAIQCSKKCSAQAQAAVSLISSIDSKYNDDQKSILIQDLDERISFLEERIAKMQ